MKAPVAGAADAPVVAALPAHPGRVAGLGRTVAGAVMAAGILVLALLLVPPFLADRAALLAARAMAEAALDDAERHLLTALRWVPQEAEHHQMLGEVYTRMALWRTPREAYLERALAAFAEAARRSPRDARTYVLMGWAHLYRNEPRAAEAAFRRARALDPANPYHRYSLGTAYLWQRRLREARTEFEAVLARFPGAPEVRLALEEVTRLESGR